jgi:hypothetical protein
LGGKPEEKRQLGKAKCRWEDNIRMNLGIQGGGYGLNVSGLVYGPMAGFI